MSDQESVILIDVSEGQGESHQDLLERFGHAVVVCHGPDEGTLCPLLARGGDCELLDSAHGIVFELDLDRPQHRAILRRYQEVVRPGVPIRVLAPAGQDEKYADLLAGVEVWTHEPTTADLDGFAARVEANDREG